VRLGSHRPPTAHHAAAISSYCKNDSVDVKYELGGRSMVATGLDIVAPSE
jgi:hypothetical protein